MPRLTSLMWEISAVSREANWRVPRWRTVMVDQTRLCVCPETQFDLRDEFPVSSGRSYPYILPGRVYNHGCCVVVNGCCSLYPAHQSGQMLAFNRWVCVFLEPRHSSSNLHVGTLAAARDSAALDWYCDKVWTSNPSFALPFPPKT